MSFLADVDRIQKKIPLICCFTGISCTEYYMQHAATTLHKRFKLPIMADTKTGQFISRVSLYITIEDIVYTGNR